MTRIPERKMVLLEDDLAMVREALEGLGSYRFSDVLKDHMASKGFSASELARRCQVSHTAIGKWRAGSAKPIGKERVKEAGLALSMNEDELNTMLLAMGYAGLYEKNPLDSACILTIRKSPDDPVGYYRELIEQFRLKEAAPSPHRKFLPTPDVRKSFDHVYTESSFRGWLSKYADGFSAFAKIVLPNKELILYTMLFIGGHSINEMYVTGELPVSIRNLLFPLIAGTEIRQKGLRDKLIVFGLLRNMPEEEIDRMLALAKLRPFSQPETRYETAMLTAVRCAHSKYAVYEYECLGKVCALLGALLENEEAEHLSHSLTESAERRRTFYSDLLIELLPRLEMAGHMTADYLRKGRRSEDERFFEECYTDAGAHSLAFYIRDMLEILVGGGDIEPDEAEKFLELLQL